MDQHLDTWTSEGVKGGLIRFYHEIANVGLVFPSGTYPFAFVGVGIEQFYAIAPLWWPIEGIEFVEEAVTALGYSTELAHHLFRECCHECGINRTYLSAIERAERNISIDQ
jgi:hypothetical protein